MADAASLSWAIDPPQQDGNVIEQDGNLSPLQRAVVSSLPPDEQFDILKAWWKADADHSRTWRREAREWFAFRAGEQWTPEDKALLDSQARPHIVFNRVLTILKAVAGMEINGRHEIHFVPRGTEDTQINEVLSAASKWMADNCDAEDEESQAFDHCATCGIGVTEQRLSFETDPAGMYVEECIDPRELYWDRATKKKNLSDSRRRARVRRMPLGDAMDLFPGKSKEQLNAAWAEDLQLDYPQKTLEEKRKRDEDNVTWRAYDDTNEVNLVHMQWIERESYWIVADVQNNSKSELTDQQYRIFVQRMQMLGMPVNAARLIRKVYKQAWLGGEMLQPASDAPIKGKFSWDVVTGEFDAEKGSWFGLVKILRDPQMWANKWLSQILHILNTTAKGGILAEMDAFEDQREAEDGYAKPDNITWLANGALSGGKPKIMAKPGNPLTDGYVGLMTFAISSFKDVSGINLELLGQQDQNQPGIIEAMRKQAGMTVLATLFDSLRRYRKFVGRGRLYFIQNFLSDGRLIRVAGPDSVKAVALAKDKTAGMYDVIVDDTPTSPNQKEANWAIIQPLLGIFRDQLMANPPIFATLLEYSPLPSRIVESIKGFIKQQQDNPQAQQDAQLDKQLQRGLITSKINMQQATAEMNNAKAGATQSTAIYDVAMARNLLEKNDFSGLKAHLDAMESAAKANKVQADAENTRAKTAREIANIHQDAANHAHNRHSKVVGDLIDRLTAQSQIERNLAAAHKDRTAAQQIANRPTLQ